MKYMSLTSATETLKRFFAGHPDSDVVSLEEIYIAAGRDLSQESINKAWVANKLTHLKHYGLVVPVYDYARRKTLNKVQLTEEGRKTLGRGAKASNNTIASSKGISLESIAQDIREFEKQNPSVKLDLGVKLREEVPIE